MKVIAGSVAVILTIGLLGGAILNDENGLFGEVVAAWVQAIGSVAAIAAAIWIDRRSSLRALSAERRAAAEREAARVRAISHAADTLTVVSHRAAVDGPKGGKVAEQTRQDALELVTRSINLLQVYLTSEAPPLTAATMLLAKERLNVVASRLGRAHAIDPQHLPEICRFMDTGSETIRRSLEELQAGIR